MIYGLVCVLIGALGIVAGVAALDYMLSIAAVLLLFGAALAILGAWVVNRERKWK